MLWRDERGTRYVRSYPARVAREQRAPRDGRMRADQEIRQHGLAYSPCSAIVGVDVAGEERRRGRNLLDDCHRRQRRAQCLDAWEPRSDLGKDDGVEHDCASLSCIGQLLL